VGGKCTKGCPLPRGGREGFFDTGTRFRGKSEADSIGGTRGKGGRFDRSSSLKRGERKRGPHERHQPARVGGGWITMDRVKQGRGRGRSPLKKVVRKALRELAEGRRVLKV